MELVLSTAEHPLPPVCPMPRCGLEVLNWTTMRQYARFLNIAEHLLSLILDMSLGFTSFLLAASDRLRPGVVFRPIYFYFQGQDLTPKAASWTPWIPLGMMEPDRKNRPGQRVSCRPMGLLFVSDLRRFFSFIVWPN